MKMNRIKLGALMIFCMLLAISANQLTTRAVSADHINLKAQELEQNRGYRLNNAILGRVIHVDDDNKDGPWDGTPEHPYKNIQDGVNAASDGDTVYVHEGYYPTEKSENFVVEIDGKNISLIGENRDNTIIDEKGATAIVVHDCGVTIKNFTIFSNIEGIELARCYKVIIEGNQILVRTKVHFHNKGIEIYNAGKVQIRDNIIETYEKTIKDDTYGILMYDTISFINISENKIEYFSSGISMTDFLSYIEIHRNRIEHNNIGIEIKNYLPLNNGKICYNYIAHNKIGIKFEGQYGTLSFYMRGNDFYDNDQNIYIEKARARNYVLLSKIISESKLSKIFDFIKALKRITRI